MSAKPLLTVLQVAAVFGGARGLDYSPTLVRALTRIPTHTLIPLSSALYLHVMGTPSELCWQGGLSLSAYFTQVCRLSSRPLPLQSAGCQLDWQLASGWPSRHVLGNNFSDKEPSGSDSNWLVSPSGKREQIGKREYTGVISVVITEVRPTVKLL